MKIIGILVLGLVALTIITAIWVRIAPSRETDWHIDPEDTSLEHGPSAAVFCPEPGSRWAGTGPADLERMDEIARAWPRTTRAFGSPAEGRVTYITRTRLMGYPDFTTVSGQAESGDICILGRQRFGSGDGGVNRHRVGRWAQSYTGANEPPL